MTLKLLLSSASSEDSDQPAHPRGLIRVFIVRKKKPCILGYPKDAHERFWWDSANAQTDQNLRWAHMSDGMFSEDAAHIFLSTGHNDIETFLSCAPSEDSDQPAYLRRLTTVLLKNTELLFSPQNARKVWSYCACAGRTVFAGYIRKYMNSS